MTFIHTHRVRSYEIDHQGFVFNGRYLEFVDDAMVEFFRFLGFGYQELIALGFDPAIVAIDLQFRTPAYLDDELRIEVGCARLGTSSLVLAFDMTRDSEAVAQVTTTYVNVEAANAASQQIPDAVRSKLASLMTEKETE